MLATRNYTCLIEGHLIWTEVWKLPPFRSIWIKILGSGLKVPQIHRINFASPSDEETLENWTAVLKCLGLWIDEPLPPGVVTAQGFSSVRGGDTWSHCPEPVQSNRKPSLFFCDVEMPTDCIKLLLLRNVHCASCKLKTQRSYTLHLYQLNSTRRCNVFFLKGL